MSIDKKQPFILEISGAKILLHRNISCTNLLIMKNIITLQEFVTTHKQKAAAALLGVTQGAVSQMLNSDRDIFIEYLADGSCRAFEQKPIGAKRQYQESACKP